MFLAIGRQQGQKKALKHLFKLLKAHQIYLMGFLGALLGRKAPVLGLR